MKFSYVRFDSKYLPIVPLIVKAKMEAEINAFVDSGAGISVFNTRRNSPYFVGG